MHIYSINEVQRYLSLSFYTTLSDWFMHITLRHVYSTRRIKPIKYLITSDISKYSVSWLCLFFLLFQPVLIPSLSDVHDLSSPLQAEIHKGFHAVWSLPHQRQMAYVPRQVSGGHYDLHPGNQTLCRCGMFNQTSTNLVLNITDDDDEMILVPKVNQRLHANRKASHISHKQISQASTEAWR